VSGGQVRCRAELIQVAAGREGRARAVEHHPLDAVIKHGHAQRLDKAVAHLAAVGVAPLRPVERYPQFASRPAGQDGGPRRRRRQRARSAAFQPPGELGAAEQGRVGERLKVKRCRDVGQARPEHRGEGQCRLRVGLRRGEQQPGLGPRVGRGRAPGPAGRPRGHQRQVKPGGQVTGRPAEWPRGDPDHRTVAHAERGRAGGVEVNDEQRRDDMAPVVEQRLPGQGQRVRHHSASLAVPARHGPARD
jgi:hypothetical protein